MIDRIDYEYMTERLLHRNYNHEDIVNILVQRGLERYSAEVVLMDALANQRKQKIWRGLLLSTGVMVLLGVFAIIKNAILYGNLSTIYYSVIPFIFGLSMVARAIKNLSE
jgi:hypothetical protein